MEETKSPWLSKTLWTQVITAGVGIAIAVGALPADYDTAGLVGTVVTVLAAVGALFRLTSTAKLTTK